MPNPVALLTRLELAKSRYWSSVQAIEHRGDKPYDQQDPSHLIMSNGSMLASIDYAFMTAATKAYWQTRIEDFGPDTGIG